MQWSAFSARLQRTQKHWQAVAWQRQTEQPHSQTKARVKKTMENSKENPKEPKVRTKVPKAHTRAKHRKLVSQVLKTRNQSEESSDIQECMQTCYTDSSWNDGWIGDEWNNRWVFDEWNDDWSSVGRHEGWEQTYDTSASSFSLGGLDVSAISSPKRFQWVKMNLDT